MISSAAACTDLLSATSVFIFLSTSQHKVHRDLRFHLHGLAVQHVRTVAPLPDRFDGRRRQHGMAAHDPQVLDAAIFTNNRLQQYHSLNAGLSRQRRIKRLDLVYQKSLRYSRRKSATGLGSPVSRPVRAASGLRLRSAGCRLRGLCLRALPARSAEFPARALRFR
jgi:hypothetical protein